MSELQNCSGVHNGMRARFNRDLEETIAIIRREFNPRFARGAVEQMRSALAPGMPDVLIDVVASYIPVVVGRDILDIFAKCRANRLKYKTVPYLIMMAVATNNLSLYVVLLDFGGFWAEMPPGPFDEFASPDVSGGAQKLIQMVANMRHYLGEGGKETRWLRKPMLNLVDRRLAAQYTVMGTSPVEHVREVLSEFPDWDYEKLLECAMSGDQDPAIIELLQKSPRL
jgi:hypothetical protein